MVVYLESDFNQIKSPLTIRKRLLKTTPSPCGGSGELETSPFASLTTTPLHSPFAPLRLGRLTRGYKVPDLAGLPPKLPSATSYIPETLGDITRGKFMAEKNTMGKTSVLLMVLLTIITYGIYLPVWFLRRQNLFNQLSAKEKLDSGGVIFVLVIFCISALFIPAKLLIQNASHIGVLDIIDNSINLLGGLIILILAFKVRRILNEHYNKHLGMNVSFSGVATFFFTMFYLQYKINRLPVSAKNEGDVA